VSEAAAYGERQLATRSYRAGDLVHQISGHRVTTVPTYLTIQVGPDTHIENLGVVDFLNHSCRPNTVVDVEALTVRAARAIAAGDELTYFYPTTEWDMDRPFDCQCGQAECVGRVCGAKHLPADVLERHPLSRHVRALIAQRP
jgi:hypothetical protein